MLCQPCTTPQPAWLPSTVAGMPHLITEFLPAIFIINTDVGTLCRGTCLGTHLLGGSLSGEAPRQYFGGCTPCLDSILKSRDITLLTKVLLVKAMRSQ